MQFGRKMSILKEKQQIRTRVKSDYSHWEVTITRAIGIKYVDNACHRVVQTLERRKGEPFFFRERKKEREGRGKSNDSDWPERNG